MASPFSWALLVPSTRCAPSGAAYLGRQATNNATRLIMSQVGQRIKKLREAQGMTLAELGSRVGVTPQAVSNWENRQTKGINGASLLRAAEALGVDPRELLAEQPKNHSLKRDEADLLDLYRTLPAGHQVLALKLLKALK